ncbi:MAG: hydrogenase maturation nickel metallochaperone HypA [Azospirillum sp.]|nr:hydrogenase maturation nickel metallochaperone HypA [Azospirillum sp.]
MHELSLAQGIIDVIREQAATQSFARVRRVRLQIGALSHVEPESIAFCFDAACRDTVAEGARLEIERPPGQAYCLACAATVTIAARPDPCPRCGGHQLMVVGGDELRVLELEVD